MADNGKNDLGNSEQKNAINRTLVGGVIGAGIGLLTFQDSGKKVFRRIGQSEAVKGVGKEVGKTAQVMVTEQLLQGIRQSAAGYMNGDENHFVNRMRNKVTGQKEKHEKDATDDYQALKEENRQLSEQLQQLEEKINQIEK